MAGPGEELDPDFRGPLPGREPWDVEPGRYDPFEDFRGAQRSQLDALAARRVRGIGSGEDRARISRGRVLTDLERELQSSAVREAERLSKMPPEYWEFASPRELRAREAMQKRRDFNALADKLDAIERMDNAKVKAHIAQTARSQAANRSNSATVARAAAFGGFASAGNQLATMYADLWYLQKKLREQRKNILRVGRRGDAATRKLPRYGIPNRTGAASTRPLGTGTGTGASASPAKPVRTYKSAVVEAVPWNSPPIQVPTSLPSTGSSTDSRQTTRQTSSTRSSSPSRSSSTSKRTTWQRILSPVRTSFSWALSPFMPARSSARSGLVPGNLGTVNSSGGKSPELSLQLQGSAASQYQCECKDKRRSSKPKKDRCSNPIISRKIEGDVLTTKRKIVCLQSK